MPYYSYICPICGNEEDKLTSYDNRLLQSCSHCGGHTEYKPSFKTGGVFGLPNGYAPTRSKSRDKRDIGGADTK